MAAVNQPRVRAWLFSNEPATAKELYLLREHKPFIINCTTTKALKLYGQCYRLSNHTALGLVLSKCARNGDLPFVEGYDAMYKENQYTVTRLVVFVVDGLVCSLEFCWLYSGSLTIRYHPYNTMLGTSLVNYEVHVFSPVDSSFLSMIAKDENPSIDFLKGRFNAMRFLSPCYSVSFWDVRFQTPCVHCTLLGKLNCSCPTPVQRFLASEPADENLNLNDSMKGTIARKAHALHDEMGCLMDATSHSGTILYNVVVVDDGNYEVPYAGIVTFKCVVQLGIQSHQVMQQFLSNQGSTIGYPWRLQIGLPDSPETSSRDISILSLLSESVEDNSTQDSCGQVMDPQCNSSIMSIFGLTITTVASRKQVGISKAKTEALFLTCPICNIQIRSKQSNLKRHIANKHGALCSFVCSEPGCDKKFQTKHNLNRHISNTHRNQSSFICPVSGCGRRYQSKFNLERHQRSAHVLSQVWNYLASE